MNRLILACLTAIMPIAGATKAFCGSTSQADLESELRQVWHQRWAALNRNDADTYATFLADEVVAPSNGLVYDKKALIELARVFKETASEPREMQVHGNENSAVLVYRTTAHYPFADHDITEDLRVVETYVKRNGRWLLTTRTESEIPNANRTPVTIARDVLDTYVGEYEVAPGKLVKIARQGDKLTEDGPDYPRPEELLALGDNSFCEREQPGLRTFTKSEDGKVEAYILWIYDATIKGKKIK